MLPNTYFEHTYCLTLPQSFARQQNIVEQKQSLNLQIEFFYGAPWTTSKPTLLERRQNLGQNNRNLLQYALSQNCSSFIFLEDDACFCKDFVQKYLIVNARLKHVIWDAVLFFCPKRFKPSHDLDLVKITDQKQQAIPAVCCGLSSEYAKKLYYFISSEILQNKTISIEGAIRSVPGNIYMLTQNLVKGQSNCSILNGKVDQ